jgi:hypothetical protein
MFRASTRDHKNGSQNNAKNQALTIIEAWPPTVSTTLGLISPITGQYYLLSPHLCIVRVPQYRQLCAF